MTTKQLLRPEEAQAQKIELLNRVLLKGVKNAADAAKFSVSFSGSTHEGIGRQMKRDKETVTRFINDNGGLKPSKIEEFVMATGNAFFLQYLAHQIGCELVPIDANRQRRAELQAELDKLDLLDAKAA